MVDVWESFGVWWKCGVGQVLARLVLFSAAAAASAVVGLPDAMWLWCFFLCFGVGNVCCC